MPSQDSIAGALDETSQYLGPHATLLQLATAVLLVLLLLAAMVIFWRQSRMANRARDLQAFFEFEKELDTYWYRLVTDRKQLAFNFAQIARFCESICFVINHRLVGRRMRELYGAHVAEIFLDWSAPGETSDMLVSLVSSDGEIEELILFFYQNRRHYRQQWSYIERLLARNQKRIAHPR